MGQRPPLSTNKEIQMKHLTASSVGNANAISATSVKLKVEILYDNGITEVRSAGSRSWRNNNPGNIMDGHFTRGHGAIGAAAGFAVFPSERTGMTALIALLNTSRYQSLSMDDSIARYAPSTANPTARYQQFVQSETGLSGKKLLNTFTRSEIQDLASAIKKFEGWLVGMIRYRR